MACFYLGGAVKVVTRHEGSAFVHEMTLVGAQLEERYRADAASTYETDMVHRSLGDTSTLAGSSAGAGGAVGGAAEEAEAHPELRGWVEAEPDLGGAGFTRVVITDIRSEAMACTDTEEGCLEIARELAHIYHYCAPAGSTH